MAELGLFTGAPQHENFARFRDSLPTRMMAPSAPVHRGIALELPDTYDFEGVTKSL